jgi:hypothetical protein
LVAVLTSLTTRELPPINLRDLIAAHRQRGRAVRDLPLNRHDLAQAERSIAGARREIGYVFAPDGSQRARRIGWESGVSFGGVDLSDAIVTHNHPANRRYPPSDPRYDGGGFSRWDLQTAIAGNVAEIRAVTERYVYTLRRPSDGWSVSAEAIAGTDDMRGRPPRDRGIYRDQLDAVRREFIRRVASGELDPATAESNAEVLHEVVRRVASIAGFTYERIERRSGR